MPDFGSDSTHRRRHGGRQLPPPESGWTTQLTRLTDAGLLLTLAAVTLCFGGRTPIGQLVLVVMTTATTLAWCARQLTGDAPGWRPTRTLWLWGLGATIPIVQIIPLTAGWLHKVSPEHQRLLTIWSSSTDGIFPAWTALSLAPSETTSGLVTFLCYALIFLVTFQRLAVISDVERLLRGIAGIGIAIAVFAVLQVLMSNGLFFWFYEHPAVRTDQYANGSFTNRNHLAQYLALMIGPAIWWLIRSAESKIPVPKNAFGPRSSAGPLRVSIVALGLAVILLAICLSLSRAGAAAMAIAVLTSLV
jgi:hypothetical protein